MIKAYISIEIGKRTFESTTCEKTRKSRMQSGEGEPKFVVVSNKIRNTKLEAAIRIWIEQYETQCR